MQRVRHWHAAHCSGCDAAHSTVHSRSAIKTGARSPILTDDADSNGRRRCSTLLALTPRFHAQAQCQPCPRRCSPCHPRCDSRPANESASRQPRCVLDCCSHDVLLLLGDALRLLSFNICRLTQPQMILNKLAVYKGTADKKAPTLPVFTVMALQTAFSVVFVARDYRAVTQRIALQWLPVRCISVGSEFRISHLCRRLPFCS
jgi:hypothetical protein